MGNTADNIDLDRPTPDPRPKTATVLVFLAAGAMILSYTAVYACTNALVSADILPAWQPGSDPRPMWLAKLFGVVFTVFSTGGLLFRWTSNRQLRAIDALADGE